MQSSLLRTPVATRRQAPDAIALDGPDDNGRDAANVRALSEALSTVPCQGSYDLEISIGERRFRVTGGSGAPLAVVLPAAGSVAAPTRIRFANADALRRVASEGQSAAMGLMARGLLTLTGDLSVVQALGQEVGPHVALLEPLVHALAFGTGAAAVVRWVADSEAKACMACSRPFTVSRRRHHCRACGEVCCARCAPKRVRADGRQARACERCAPEGGFARRRGLSAVADSPMGNGSSPSSAGSPFTPASRAGGGAPPTAARADPAESGVSASEVVLELMIESALARFRLRWLLLRSHSIGVTLGGLAFGFHRTSGAAYASWGRLALGAVALLLLFGRNMLLRYYRITWLCLVIAANTALASFDMRGRSALAVDARWELTHRTNARFLYDTVASLGGFWVKLAQSTSISSALPDVYRHELSKLQDAMPADPIEEVEALLAKELGTDWRKRVTLEKGPPLGSATIAQVRPHPSPGRRRYIYHRCILMF